MPITIQFQAAVGATTANIYLGPGAVGDLPPNPVTIPAVGNSGIGVLVIDSWVTRPDGVLVIEADGYRSIMRLVPGIDAYELACPPVTGGTGDSRHGEGAYRLTIPVVDGGDDGGDDGITGARVSISGTTLVATTGTLGVVVFNVDAGEYAIRVMPPSGYETPNDVDVEVIDGDFIVDPFVLLPLPIPSSSDPVTCAVSVKVISKRGTPIQNATVFSLLNSDALAQSAIVFNQENDATQTNASGLATLTLVRGIKVCLQAQLGKEKAKLRFTVPDLPSAIATITI
jgi:hypothetical protein